MNVRWTPEAVDDLARLYDFLAEHNPPAAMRAITILRSSVRQLITHPRLGRSLTSFEPRDVRRLVIGAYELRYEVAGEAIHILRFFHTREDR